MFSRPTLALVGALLAPATAFAQAPSACPMTYDAFEALVPHLDLADCPEGMGGVDRFCRLAVSAERAHVFEFETASGCLVASRAWEEDAFSVTLD